MKIFLIRHGRSADHDSFRRQSPESSLGEIGKKQARQIAERVRQEKIDKVFSSPWPRALETAKTIAKAINKKVEILDYIHEKESEASVYGMDMNSEEFQNYVKQAKKYGSSLDWKYRNGGESIRDVIKRVEKFQKHLIQCHLGKNIIAVTHGHFCRCFVGYCVLDKDYDDKSFYKLFDALKFENTGMSLIEYDEKRRKWNIVYINDHSHLRLDRV